MAFTWVQSLSGSVDPPDLGEIKINIDAVVDALICHTNDTIYHSDMHNTYCPLNHPGNDAILHTTYNNDMHTTYLSGNDGTDNGSYRSSYNSSDNGNVRTGNDGSVT